TGQDRWVRSQFRPDDLQCDEAIEFAVPGLVNRAHAAFTDGLQDLVASAQHHPRKQGRKLPARTGGSGWRRWAARLATVEQRWGIRGCRLASRWNCGGIG